MGNLWRRLKTVWNTAFRHERTDQLDGSAPLPTPGARGASRRGQGNSGDIQRRTQELYFVANCVDERKLDHYRYLLSSENYDCYIGRIGGQPHMVRRLSEYSLFRRVDAPDIESAMFLEGRLPVFIPRWLWNTPGRCTMLISPWMPPGDATYVFFRADGSGFSLQVDRALSAYAQRFHVMDRDARFERIDFGGTVTSTMLTMKTSCLRRVKSSAGWLKEYFAKR